MKKSNVKNSLLLLLTATIWGTAFVAQSVGMDYIEPFTFNAIRCFMGGLVLIPFIWFSGRRASENITSSAGTEKNNKTLITGGILCGILLALATNLQQIGIKYTTVGKAGFITACYIVIVPVLGILFFKKKCRSSLWVAVGLALIGLYLLSIKDGFNIGKGDFYIFLCSILFSLHILTVDHFSPLVDGVKMSCIQFFVCGILSGIPALLFESPDISNILNAWGPLVYAGVFSCGIAYTLQIVGQKNMNPTTASLILSLESCISVLAGWLLLNQTLTARELTGCVLMFAAILLAQLPEKK